MGKGKVVWTHEMINQKIKDALIPPAPNAFDKLRMGVQNMKERMLSQGKNPPTQAG